MLCLFADYTFLTDASRPSSDLRTNGLPPVAARRSCVDPLSSTPLLRDSSTEKDGTGKMPTSVIVEVKQETGLFKDFFWL